MGTPRVFVSHATPDADFANRLSDDLRRLGADTWLDSTHLGTGDFVARINAALQGRDLVVLILSPSAIQSPWVSQEVNAAIVREKQGSMRPMIVVMAQPCTLSTIPPLWTVYQRYDATTDYSRALYGLAQELSLHVPAVQRPAYPLPAVQPTSPPAAQPRTVRPNPWLIWVGILVVLLAVFMHFFVRLPIAHVPVYLGGAGALLVVVGIVRRWRRYP